MKASPWLIATVTVVLGGCGDGDDLDWASILEPKPGYFRVAGAYTGSALFEFDTKWGEGYYGGSGQAVVVQSGDDVTMNNGLLTFEDEAEGWKLMLPAVTGTINNNTGAITITAIDTTGFTTFNLIINEPGRPGPPRECDGFTITDDLSLSFTPSRLEFRGLYGEPFPSNCADVKVDISASLQRLNDVSSPVTGTSRITGHPGSHPIPPSVRPGHPDIPPAPALRTSAVPAPVTLRNR